MAEIGVLAYPPEVPVNGGDPLPDPPLEVPEEEA